MPTWEEHRRYITAQMTAHQNADTQRAYMEMTGQCLAMPSTIPSADADDVLREQLEYLIEQPDSERYRRVRDILMEPFGEPERALTKGAGQ